MRLLLLTLILVIAISCKKDEPELTDEKLILGTWYPKEKRHEYYNAAGVKVFEETDIYDPFIASKLVFHSKHVLLDIPGNLDPTPFYSIENISGQKVLTLDGSGLIENTFILHHLDNKSMVWFYELGETDYVENHFGKTAKSAKLYVEFIKQ